MARTASAEEPKEPQGTAGPITAQKIAEGSITAQQIAPYPTPAPDPDVVYVSTVGYPGSVLLLFHADGRVTWK